MDLQSILDTLRAHEGELRARGVAHAALFGSRARGDDRADSDIDIMVELAPEAKLGVWEYVGVKQFIERLFDEKVEVSNRMWMRDYVKPNAERDAVFAF